MQSFRSNIFYLLVYVNAEAVTSNGEAILKMCRVLQYRMVNGPGKDSEPRNFCVEIDDKWKRRVCP